MLLKYFVIISLVFIQFYNTGNHISSYASALIMVGLLAFNIFNFGKYKRKEIVFTFTKSDGLVLLFFISLIRSFLADAISITTLVYLSTILILFSTLLKADVQKEGFWKSFLLAVFLVVVLNLLFYSAGITSEIFKHKRTNDIRILSYIGIAVQRVNFLIFNNFAYYSMLVSLLILGSFSLVDFKKKSRFIIYLLSFVTLIFLDARGPLLFLVLILLAQKYLVKINSRNLLVLFVSIIVVPFIFSLVTAYFGFGEEENLELASSRDVIWGYFLLNYQPNVFEFLFGYGYLGQYISGISKQYEFLFGEWDNGSQISLHNSYLQHLTDIGLVGLYGLYSVLKSTLYKIDVLRIVKTKLILVYLIIAGVSEMSIQINNFVCFYFFIAFTNYIEYKYNDHLLHLNTTKVN